MNNQIECNLYGIDGEFYLIPHNLVDKFEALPYYEKKEEFSNYCLPYDLVIEEIFVSNHDIESLLDGDFE